MTQAITTAGLARRFGRREALAGVDMAVPAGAIAGLLGPNGAGKSTLLHLLMGLQRPSSGNAAVLGLDVVRQSREVRTVTDFVPQERDGFRRMRVRRFLDFTRNASPRWDDGRAERLIARWEIPAAARLGELSSGVRSHLMIAAAIARRPRVLLLDEATAGLDPAAVDDTLIELTSLAADGTTVVLATHRLEEVERICDRLVVLDRGRVVLDGELDDVRERWRVVETARHPPQERLAEWEEVASVTVRGDVARLVVRRDPDAVVARLTLFGAVVLAARPLSLRDIYFAVTGRNDESDARDVA